MSAAAPPGFAIARVGRSAALITLAVAFGQVFGIGRELYVANQVGIAPQLDALLVALVVPTMLSGLLVSGTAAALLPAYAAIERHAGQAAARCFSGAILTWTGLIGIVAAIIVVSVGSAIVSVTGPGLSLEAREEGIRFLSIVAPIIVFGSMAGLVTALCQIAGRFGPIALASVVGPLTSMLVTIAGWPAFGLTALALGTTAGLLATLLVLFGGALRLGLLPAPTLRVRRHGVGFVRHALPLWASSMTLQMNVLVDRAVSSILAVGAVSALRFGEGIIRIPLTSIGPAWGMVLYPSLVREAQADSRESLGRAAVTSFRYVFSIFVPISVATAAMAPLIVDVAYRRGAFGAEAAGATTGVAAALAPMIVVTMVEAIVVGAHNAQRRGTLLFLAGVANVAIHLVLNLAFGLTFGVAGVALSTSVTMALVLGFLTMRLARTEPAFDLGDVAGSGIRAVAASMVPGVPIAAWVWVVYRPGSFLENLVLLVGLMIAGFVTYLVMASRLGLGEPAIVLRTLRRYLPFPSRSAA